MRQGIYFVKDDGDLVLMNEAPYISEDALQSLLARHPSLLSGDNAITQQPRWLLVSRESSVPSEMDGSARWSVDHVFLDREGIPTLVEVKRSTDTRIRREVVGQMLDYAANAVVYWPVEKIQSEFETTCVTTSKDPSTILAEHLGQDGPDPEAFWQLVKTNLQAGRIRMVFVADVIGPELTRIVEFLNTQMDPAEVIAIEIRQYIGEGAHTLVPRIIGQTVQAQQRKGTLQRESRQWDEQSFFDELAKSSADSVAVARELLDWATKRELRIWWGKGKQWGSFFPMLDVGGVQHWTVSVWTGGTLEIQFGRMQTRQPFVEEPLRRALLSKFRECNFKGEDGSFPDDCITRRPSIKLSALKSEQELAKLTDVLDWYVDQVKQAASVS